MRVVGRGYADAVLNLEVIFRSLGGGSKEKMQEDWESIDLKKCLLAERLTHSTAADCIETDRRIVQLS